MSRFDKSRKKFGFYKSVGVRELLLVDRHPWALELYRVEAGDWALVGSCRTSRRLAKRSPATCWG